MKYRLRQHIAEDENNVCDSNRRKVIGMAWAIFESNEAAAIVSAAYEADPRMVELSLPYVPKRAYYEGFEIPG